MKRSRRRTIALSLVIGTAAACTPAQTGTTTTPGTTLTGDDFRDPTESIESVLQKKVPGLALKRNSDGSLSLQVRGAASLNGGDTTPLYVLNGVPFHPGPGGSLSGINPRDIDTVRVLKGPDTAMYGIDGANGVIVITTKSAAKRSP